MMHVFLKSIFESSIGLEAWRNNMLLGQLLSLQIYLYIFSKEQKLLIYIFCFLQTGLKKKIAAKVNMCAIISRIPVISYTYVAIY